MRTFTQNFKITSVIVVLSLSIQGCYTYVPSMSRETDGVYYNPSKDTERTEYLKNRNTYYSNTYSSAQNTETEQEYYYEEVTPTEIAYWSTMPSQYQGDTKVTIIENPSISYYYYPTYTPPTTSISLGWNSTWGWSIGVGIGYSWGYPYYGWYDSWYYDPWYRPWGYNWMYNPWYYGGWYDPWYYHHHHPHYPPYPWYDGPGHGPGGPYPPGGRPHYSAPHRYNSTSVPNSRRPISRDNDRDDNHRTPTRTPSSSGGNYGPAININNGGTIIRSNGGYYRRIPTNTERVPQDGTQLNNGGKNNRPSSPSVSPQNGGYRPSSPQNGTPTRVNTTTSSGGERSQYRNVRGSSSSNKTYYRPSTQQKSPNGVRNTSSYKEQNNSSYSSPTRSSYSPPSRSSSPSSSSSSSGGYRRR